MSSGLLDHAIAYRVLASAFLYPDHDVRPLLLSDEFVGTLGRALRGIDGAHERLLSLADAIGVTRSSPLDLAAEYVALFTRNVPCSPYGSRYLVADVMARPRVLAEVTSYYSAFGVQVDREHPDLPDHVGMELEFLGHLLAKERHALDNGWDERAATCRDARARFMKDHMLLWFPLFRERVHTHARLPYYGALADLTMVLLEEDARSLDISVAGPAPWRTDGPVGHETDDDPGVPGTGDDRDGAFECGVLSR